MGETRPGSNPEEGEYFDDIIAGETDEFLQDTEASTQHQTFGISLYAKIFHLLFFSASLALFIAGLTLELRSRKCDIVTKGSINTDTSTFQETNFYKTIKASHTLYYRM